MTEEFEDKLQEKTGWGRNDVLVAYRQCVNDAILDSMDVKPSTNE